MMKSLLLLLVVGAIIIGSHSKLPPPEKQYKFLMLMPFASKSHRNVFLPIAEGLANRGHKVVIVSPLAPVTQNHNIEEIHHGVETFSEEGANMFEVREKNENGGFAMFKEYLPKIAKEMYQKPVIQELYKKKDEFDVVLVDSLFNEPAYPFTYKRPFILVSTSGKFPTWSATQGNVYNPSYIPFFNSYPMPYSFINRIKNLAGHIGFPLMWRTSIAPLIQAEISKHFPDLPSIYELERNASLVLMNTHFSLDISSPNLPSQIEVGTMHCKPGKSLNPGLQEWIDGAGPEGVVYFSLGSVTKGDYMPVKYRDMFVKAFGRIKQRVIWKFESDIEDLPKNIMKKSWLPQQDILAHPNVKVFITHGGGLSTQESIYHNTPLIALPIFGDQPRNGEWIYQSGHGLHLVWEQITEDMIVEAIQDVVYNPKYQNNVAAASRTLKDQPMLPKDLAVWWTEYIARHEGAPGLKCPGADLSWIEYLMLDVILLLHLIIFIIYMMLKKVICMFTSKKSVSKKKKTN